MLFDHLGCYYDPSERGAENTPPPADLEKHRDCPPENLRQFPEQLDIRRATITFDDQPVDGLLDDGPGPTYKGTLLGQIPVPALRFWSDYEEAVNSMMLIRVDDLERRMPEYRFHVHVGGRRYRGEDVDLQVFPSSLRFSFSVMAEGHAPDGEDGTEGSSGHEEPPRTPMHS